MNVIDEKSAAPPPGTNYGNMPLEVSQSGSSNDPAQKSKFEQGGKKIGKKFGNAGTYAFWR